MADFHPTRGPCCLPSGGSWLGALSPFLLSGTSFLYRFVQASVLLVNPTVSSLKMFSLVREPGGFTQRLKMFLNPLTLRLGGKRGAVKGQALLLTFLTFLTSGHC